MFRLDEDLSPFYEALDEDLAWCAFGAGRMLRAPTVFEDVVKTNERSYEHRLEWVSLTQSATYRGFRKCTSSGSSS
jgi:hypothetical protein